MQVLFLHNFPYAYYVHCLAHKLQLTLIIASREIISIIQFFSKLTLILNIIGVSCKCIDELCANEVSEIVKFIATNEVETGTWCNQIGTYNMLKIHGKFPILS